MTVMNIVIEGQLVASVDYAFELTLHVPLDALKHMQRGLYSLRMSSKRDTRVVAGVVTTLIQEYQHGRAIGAFGVDDRLDRQERSADDRVGGQPEDERRPGPGDRSPPAPGDQGAE